MEWWIKCLVLGGMGGLLAGLLGVGGGIIMVPLLMVLLKMEIHDAKAQSLAIIVLSAVTGTIQSHRVGRIDWSVVVAAGLGAAVMSPIGVHLAERLPREALLRLFACLMIITGIKYLAPARPAAETPAPAALEPVEQPATR